jgi:hypothetical protein
VSTSPVSVPPPTSPASGGGTSLPAQLWAEFLRHGKRWLTCDFSRMSATDEERRALAQASPPITDAVTQDYVAWRRSMAWIGTLLVAVATVHALIELATTESGPESGTTGFVDFLAFVTFASHGVLLVALLQSARLWTRPAADRRRLRWGWAIGLFVPVLMLLLPLKDLMFDLPAEQAPVEAGALDGRGLYLGAMSLLLAIMAFWSALPGLLSVFPGMMRAGALLKTLVPGRSMGSVVTLALGPIYALLLLVICTSVQQLSDNVVILFGALALLSTPIVTFRAAWAMVPPCTREQAAERFARYRKLARWPTLIGLILVGIGLFTTKIFGFQLIGYGNALIKVHALVLMAVWFFAMLTTYTVVSADALLQAMHIADQQTTSWHGSPDLKRDIHVVADMEASLSPEGQGAAHASGSRTT